MVHTRLNEMDMGFLFDDSLENQHPYAGITSQASEIPFLSESLSRGLAILGYKDKIHCLWVVLLGGTGTGKSTLFNAVRGKTLSATGVERPKTSGPIAIADARCPLEKGFPFSDLSIRRVHLSDLRVGPATGNPGEFLIIDSTEKDWSKVILVDTPDLDSVERENRLASERFYLLSDLVLFVTSQEKYADQVLHQFLQRVIRDGKPFYYLVNKTDSQLRLEDVATSLRDDPLTRGAPKAWLIPYGPGDAREVISSSEPFHEFLTALRQKTSGEKAALLRHQEISRLSVELAKRTDSLIRLLYQEKEAAKAWLQRLDDLFVQTTAVLLKREKEHFSSKSRDLLREKVRALFSRYDPLAKPRRLVREVVRLPLRLIGFGFGAREANRDQELQRVAHKIDLSILRECIHQFNRLVLENLSPQSPDTPLFTELRKPDISMTDGEISTLIRSEQERLAAWLEETFEKMAQEIPRGKKWGIYSTSVLWGLLIISFETIVGGGFTVLDAFLDSAIAPFVTKGATELFAYQEIQRVARKMAKRYEEGLLAIVLVQKDRYEACLKALIPSDERLEGLRALHVRLEGYAAKGELMTKGRGPDESIVDEP